MSIGKYSILALVVAGLTAIAAQAQTAPAVEMISAEELKAKVSSNQPVTIIDVRSSEGYAASSTTIKGAIHFKLRKLKSRLAYRSAERSSEGSRDRHLLRLPER